ncbi:MAG: GIY-YIG nuclease family protein [Gemmatimonadota bacterium]
MRTGWYVYLAQCGDGSLYSGATTNPEQRIATHNRGRGAAYTRSRLPVTLVYVEAVADRSSALRREAAFKRMTRLTKLKLIRQAVLAEGAEKISSRKPRKSSNATK